MSQPAYTVVYVPKDGIWTAEELERMSPDERQRLFDESVVTDLTQVSPEFLARVRAKGRALLAERGIIAPADDAPWCSGRHHPTTHTVAMVGRGTAQSGTSRSALRQTSSSTPIRSTDPSVASSP